MSHHLRITSHWNNYIYIMYITPMSNWHHTTSLSHDITPYHPIWRTPQAYDTPITYNHTHIKYNHFDILSHPHHILWRLHHARHNHITIPYRVILLSYDITPYHHTTPISRHMTLISHHIHILSRLHHAHQTHTAHLSHFILPISWYHTRITPYIWCPIKVY